MAETESKVQALTDALASAKKELNRSYTSFEAIFEMIKVIHSTLDASELSGLVMDIIESVMGFEVFSLFVFDDRHDFLFQGQRNLPEDVFQNLSEKIQENKYTWAKNMDITYSIKESPHGMEISCLPLKTGEKMIGAFCAPRKTVELSTPEDGKILSLIAAQITTAYQNSLLYELAKRLSITDELTKVYNYRYLQSQLDVETNRAQRYKRPLSLLMIDLDNFKSYNDKFGHVRGDLVLLEVAKIISNNCRGVDVVARYGGEEFAVILPETNYDGAMIVSERIRKMVSEYRFLGDQQERSEKITVSIGVSGYVEGMCGKELVQKADEALYEAKRSGKNRVS